MEPPNYGLNPNYESQTLTRVENAFDDPNFRKRVSDQAPGWALFGAKAGGVNDDGQPNWFSSAKPLTKEESKAASSANINLQQLRNPNPINWHLGTLAAFDRLPILGDPSISKARTDASMALDATRVKKSDRAWELTTQERIGDKAREDSQSFQSSMNDRNIQARSQEVEQQGKLNMRQSMMNSVNERALANANAPFRRLT